VFQEDIYTQEFVSQLFDEMAATYGLTNYVASFGFCERWREQCIRQVSIRPQMTVFDFMTGMGECWHIINRSLRNQGKLIALDLSEEMCRRGQAKRSKLSRLAITIVRQDVLANGIAANTADCIISSFGLKTFSPAQLALLAGEMGRILKPGATFSLLEISVPPCRLLRRVYLFYLKYCIPIIGWLFLGNPDTYRLLGIYTENFGDCSLMANALRQVGLHVEQVSYFLGCATGLRGSKPLDS
jgi:demethylmenaquinone methyltransferase/2-methoxy-6-polyprenyl-1,4-benzoquinol methylase